jgi:two-component system chemotaxis response regulator CheY
MIMARILICDDSDFIRSTIREMLTAGGHEVVGEAKNGDEAAEKYTQLKPDLVTMDILMKPSGVEGVRTIKSKDPSARIIIITVLDGRQSEIVEAIQLGANGYIPKPIRQESLLKEVKRVLKK